MKGPYSGRKNLFTRVPAIGETLASAKNSALIRRIAVLAVTFATSLCLSGVELFPGTYPFGTAFFASSSGVLSSVAALAGAIIGTARIEHVRGIYIMVYILLALARGGVSLWLDPAKKNVSSSVAASIGEWKKSRDAKKLLASIGRTALLLVRGGASKFMNENILVRSALSACAALFAGAWSVIGGGYVYYDLFGAIFSLFIVPLFTYLFYAGISRNMRASRVREIGVYFTIAAVVLALHSISSLPLSADPSLSAAGIASRAFTFDLGVLAAFAAAVVVTHSFGMHRGILCGIICGAVLTPVYAPAYAAAAVVCGFLFGVSETFAVILGGAVAAAWGIYTGGIDGMIALFPPIVGACALLVPAFRFGLIRLPDWLLVTRSAGAGADRRETMAVRSADDIARRVEELSDGLGDVASVLDGLSKKLTAPERVDARDIVVSVFAFNCAKCRNRGTCREGRDPESSPVTAKMAEALGEYGVVSADIVPPELASECWNMGKILDEINLTASHKLTVLENNDKLAVTAADCALAADLLGSAARDGASVGEINEAATERLRPVISGGDFSASNVAVYGERELHVFVDDVDISSSKAGAEDIREMFEGALGCALSSPEFSLDGEVLSMRMSSLPSLVCASGAFSRSAADVIEETEGGATVEVYDSLGDAVCGDVITSFEACGRYYMILSDGMGTGKEAAVTSGVVTSVLERLLKSGAELESSLKLLNHIVRSAGRECSATVDIAEIDMVSGVARFIKSGAAPSFVIRDGGIFRLQSKTVPIGIIRALDAEMIKFEVRAGDTVVMVSDGAARSYDEVPWLLDLMTYDPEITGGDEARAAEKIVNEAKKRGSSDDVSAGIIRIGGR